MQVSREAVGRPEHLIAAKHDRREEPQFGNGRELFQVGQHVAVLARRAGSVRHRRAHPSRARAGRRVRCTGTRTCRPRAGSPPPVDSPCACVAHANSVIATVASIASIRPRPPSRKPKKRPCSCAPAIIVTRLMTAAQNVRPVVRPQPPKIMQSIDKRRRGRIQQAERAGCDQREADQDARRDAVREPAARQIAEQENQAERRVQIAELAIGDMKHFEHRRLIDLPQIQDRVNGAGGKHEQRELQIALAQRIARRLRRSPARAGKPIERVEMTRESPDDTYRDARVRRSCLRFVFDVGKSGGCRPPPAVLQYFMTTRRVCVNSSMPCLPSSPPRPERFQPAWKP